MVKKVILFLCSFLVYIQLYAEFSSIELIDGRTIQGEVIYEKPDKVFVDLGFTLIVIPPEMISQITSEKRQAAYRTEAFYQVKNNPLVLPVKALVEECGEAVVLVQTPTSVGSGFFIHPDGYVVTNEHVIAGEYAISILVFKKNGEALEKIKYDNVRIIATSYDWDLALLKIETDKDASFNILSLGDSDGLRQGQMVLSIGNPLGLERTVSKGIISLKNRLIGGRLAIQTTAQISPGNSGGPLFNSKGEVIGVNNMKIVAQGAEGLGFAIPSNTLKTFLKNIDAFAFDPRNPNAGYRYNQPPSPASHHP